MTAIWPRTDDLVLGRQSLAFGMLYEARDLHTEKQANPVAREGAREGGESWSASRTTLEGNVYSPMERLTTYSPMARLTKFAHGWGRPLVRKRTTDARH